MELPPSYECVKNVSKISSGNLKQISSGDLKQIPSGDLKQIPSYEELLKKYQKTKRYKNESESRLAILKSKRDYYYRNKEKIKEYQKEHYKTIGYLQKKITYQKNKMKKLE